MPTKDLKELELKSTYRSGTDDLLNDFYIPALSTAKYYDRAVGYFSTALIAYALKGISSIIKNDGQMRLIVGFPLSEDEFEALKHGKSKEHIDKKVTNSLIELYGAADLKLEKERLALFSLLVATGKLKLKFAFKRQGMYHEKVGIITDTKGNKVLFHGSANETTNAIHPGFNFESFAVYKNWKKEIYEEFAQNFQQGFEKLWCNEEKDIFCLDMPSELYEKISRNYIANRSIDLHDIDECAWEEELAELAKHNYPFVPTEIQGNPFRIYQHQKDALANWYNNGLHGLFKLATGAGKTITAMYGIAKIFEAAKKPRKMCVIIAVPYVALAEQWCKELKIFGMQPTRCFGSTNKWQNELSNKISNLLLGNIEFLSIVVVNKTLRESEVFKQHIGRISPNAIFFIGDECHRHGTESMARALPQAEYKMGLSATPYIEDEDYLERNTEKSYLLSYYGPVIAEYTLEDALDDKVLTPYRYHIVEVYLTSYEHEEYLKLTKEIGRQMSIDNSPRNTQLANAIRERNKVVQNASNKENALEKQLIVNKNNDKSHTLFYTGEGKVNSEDDEQVIQSELERIAAVLRRNGWKVSKFTSKESSKARLEIMNSFVEKHIDALVSMRVLDEGIDIPQCNTAYIMASSTNSRQFIQRRGRILRKYPGKKEATIYDFVVLPDRNSEIGSTKDLVKKELKRVMDFVRPSLNRPECQKEAERIAGQFDIDIKEV